MAYVKWSFETLNKFCGDAFRKFGFSDEEADIITDVLLTADIYGIESHGMQRRYRRPFRNGPACGRVRYEQGHRKG